MKNSTLPLWQFWPRLGRLLPGPPRGRGVRANGRLLRGRTASASPTASMRCRSACARSDIGPGDEVIVPRTRISRRGWPSATWVRRRFRSNPSGDLQHRSRVDRSCDHAAHPRVLPVHLYGQPADLAADRGNRTKPWIGDSRGRCPGARRTLPRHRMRSATPLVWSFYPGKNLGAIGDGGSSHHRRPAIADRVRCCATTARA